MTRGSTWGKWDFHIHTPYSILNNQFGFDPFDSQDDYHEKQFDEYVKYLFNKAIENGIVAIGITDYFMIDGYKRIKEKYLDCPEKLEECFPDEEIRAKVKKIFVFPNIELRLNTFVGAKASSVNYHVIFSNEVSITDIENNFLDALKIEFNPQDKRNMNKYNIECFGKEIIKQNNESGNPLLVGLKHITLSYDSILKVLSNPIFEKKHLIAVPVDEDLSKIDWNGRDYTTRKIIYRQSHCYMTSNTKTRDWALAINDDEQSRIEEFGSLKPCIWGSDAHSYERMFTPNDERYCWVKSQPTFEGLLQILYEPATRVSIGKTIPASKDQHQLIQSIQFNNTDFPNTPIGFNDSLVCIIGGKSTGKSLLLRNIAYAIDPQYAKKQEAIVGNLKPIKEGNATILWQDGTKEARKIVYIPQTYLNRTIDDPEKTTEIDSIIADVLLQEPEISKAYEELQNTLNVIKGKVFTDITIFEDIQKQLRDIRKLLLEDGKSTTFVATIESLEKQRMELADKIDITQDDINKYTSLKEKIEGLKRKREDCSSENNLIDTIQTPVIFFHDLSPHNNSDSSEQIRAQLRTRAKLVKQIEDFILKYNPELAKLWEEEKQRFKGTNTYEINSISDKLSSLIPEFERLKQKVEQNEQLKKIAEQITTEKSKLKISQEREAKEQELINELEKKRNEINQSHIDYHQAYLTYCKVVNKIGVSKSTSLSFDAKTEWRKKAFTDFIYDALDNRYFTTFNSSHEYLITDPKEVNYDNSLLMDIWDALLGKVKYGGLHLKSSYTLKGALQRLFDDWYNIHYTVTSGNDTISDMSPGKKALALLELLISLEDTQCPILIDQPEDDLDNRSIYNELVRFIKEKKCERQIIVVTHNANVVLGADAEQVIVANQAGNDTPNNDNLRFEYRSGAIEDNDCEIDNCGIERHGILSRKGIQTQICDILEGGKPAFELRRNKYTSNHNV